MKIVTIDRPCIDHGNAGNSDGYTTHRTKEHGRVLLHRLVFFETHGFFPPVVMHKCDNPRCIEPTHLAAGDRDANNKDRAQKGRSAKNVPSRRKITFAQAQEIRAAYVPGYSRENGVVPLARRYGVDTNVIYNIVKGRTHRA